MFWSNYKRYFSFLKNNCIHKSFLLITSLSFVEGEYNTTTHACCEGHRKEKTGKSWRCCGKDMIDYNVEDCCAGKSYNKRNQQCCSGDYSVLHISTIAFICCISLSTLYNLREMISLVYVKELIFKLNWYWKKIDLRFFLMIQFSSNYCVHLKQKNVQNFDQTLLMKTFQT